MKKQDALMELFKSSKRIEINYNSKMVFFSDCHRCDGTFKDNLMPNFNMYLGAIEYYYREGFTYFELGDGDELWEVSKIEDIYNIYRDIYDILLEFKKSNRLYMIYGNHDKSKISKGFKKKIESFSSDKSNKKIYEFYKDLFIYESLVLRYKKKNKEIFLLHGHQVDFLNDKLNKVAHFLVRFLWSPLEQVSGFKDPTSAAKNKNKGSKIDKRLRRWVKKTSIPIIAGHTHNSNICEKGSVAYLNDGCCVAPYSITAIELKSLKLTLVKWYISLSANGELFVKRRILGEAIEIEEL